MVYPANIAKNSHNAKSKFMYTAKKKKPFYSNTNVFLILPKIT